MRQEITNQILRVLITGFLLILTEQKASSQCINMSGDNFSFCIITKQNASGFTCADGSITLVVYANNGNEPVCVYYGIGNRIIYGLSGNPVTFNNVPGNSYTVSATIYRCDPFIFGTTGQMQVDLNPPCTLSGDITVTASTVYGCSNATMTLTGYTNSCDGWGGYEGGGASGASVTSTDLSPGTYTFSMYSHGCQLPKTFVIPAGPDCNINITGTATGVSCVGCNDGSISFTGISNACNGYQVKLNGIFHSLGLSGETKTFNNLAPGTYTVELESRPTGCTDIETFVITEPVSVITLNMKLFLQGYYTGAGIMQSVLNSQTVLNSLATETDSITVELHDPTTFALIDTKVAVLSTGGIVSASFTQPAGSYYIAIKHRNTIQTWSANPVACSAATALYDFSSASSQAMGNNQVEVQTGIWAFFTGDLNQDDFIDGNDFPAFDTDSFNGVNGVYVATDMNGDGFVDGNDFPVFDVNSFNGVSAVHP